MKNKTWLEIEEIKLKLRSFKSSEQCERGPYRGFDY